jgi:hypothetical protein
MGLLVSGNLEEDKKAIIRVADRVSILWNEHGGEEFGFKIRHGSDQIEYCSRRACEILRRHFPDPPGPFKRVAALLVFGRLYPFFEFDPPRRSDQENEEWLARIVALMLPVSLRLLHADISSKKEVQTLKSMDAWKGFPSVHYKVEFLAFMQWLDNLEWFSDCLDGLPENVITEVKQRMRMDEVIDNRLARMILATSLIIEACYYGSEILPKQSDQAHLRGKCLGCIDPKGDTTALSYDARLFENYKKAQAAKSA